MQSSKKEAVPTCFVGDLDVSYGTKIVVDTVYLNQATSVKNSLVTVHRKPVIVQDSSAF